MSKTLAAIAALIGTVIGAGILGLPYVIRKPGLPLGLILMILIATILVITQLYLGEIALRTKANRHLPGYAEKYLGKKGGQLMFLALAFGIYAALIAYLIGEGESLSYLLFKSTNYSLHLGLAFWIILSAITFFGIKALEEGEKTGIFVIIILIISMTILYWNKIDLNNLTTYNPSFFFVPFRVVLFAFLGFASIPEIERILKKEKHNVKKSILWAYVLIFLIYTTFTAIVLGVKGTATPEIATLGLGKIFVILGMLTMATSYLALSISLIDVFRFDFKKSKISSWLYVILLPPIFFIILNFLHIATFTKVLGVGGVISGGLTGILILLMVKKAKQTGDRKPEYEIPYSKLLTWIIIIILTIGTILEIINTV